MSKLWAKNNSQNSNHYVNLFAKISGENWANEVWIQDSIDLFAYRDNNHSTELRMDGNRKFCAGQWSAAMNQYNKSLCFAQINSENCALAYAKRAECFFEMEFYRKALNDIELAYRANIPKRFHAKLDECKQKCHKMSCQTQRQAIDPIRLSFEANKQYPCMANVLELKQDPEFGRHLVARQV